MGRRVGLGGTNRDKDNDKHDDKEIGGQRVFEKGKFSGFVADNAFPGSFSLSNP